MGAMCDVCSNGGMFKPKALWCGTARVQYDFGFLLVQLYAVAVQVQPHCMSGAAVHTMYRPC